MGIAGGFAAFKLSPHVHERVLRFLDPDSTGGMVDTFQVDTALQSILSGGWLGRGPGEGVYKRILPDAHTDFVFAVTGEEFGMIACMALIAFFAFIVLRAPLAGLAQPGPVLPVRAAGLTMMFGVQSWINMAVNLRAMPAKGMTLPFISYGGSSLLALGLGMGFLIAATRKRPAADLRPSGRAGRMSRRRADPARGRGHRRPSVSRRRARRGAREARRRKSSSRPTSGRSNTAVISPPAPSTPFRSATTTARARSTKARAALTLGAGVAAALVKLRRIRPRAVVGFGGYPTVPPLLAAWLLKVPSVLHEQNAVMGRANRFLSAASEPHRLWLSRP